jgi:hypothetical protein
LDSGEEVILPLNRRRGGEASAVLIRLREKGRPGVDQGERPRKKKKRQQEQNGKEDCDDDKN